MWLWVEDMIGFVRDRRDALPVNKLKKITESDSASWNADHVRSRIIDAEEMLHLKTVWQKIVLTWTFLGNALLISLVLFGRTLSFDWVSKNHDLMGLILVASLVLSPVLSYFQYRKIRKIKIIIRKLHFVLRRVKGGDANRSVAGGDESAQVLAEQRRYREEIPEVVSQYREEANRYRRVHNRLQSVIIVGSVLTSAVTTASVTFAHARWGAVGISAVVGLAAGFTGYFKYRERSFNLQQTADAIEREFESVELRVGRYANLDTSRAYMMFASTVEILRDEQNKRQQQLDQPVEVKQEE